MSIFRFILFLIALSITAQPLTYAAEKIDINTADAWVLKKNLYGVGEKKAEAIVEYRDKNGLFKTIYELNKVHGIGDKIIEANMDKIVAIVPEEPESADPTTEKSPPEEPVESATETTSE